MSVSKVLRNGVIGALIAGLPISTSIAAVRPNAAVPTAGSAAVVAQDDEAVSGGVAWAAVAIIAVTIIVALWIAVDDDPDGNVAISDG